METKTSEKFKKFSDKKSVLNVKRQSARRTVKIIRRQQKRALTLSQSLCIGALFCQIISQMATINALKNRTIQVRKSRFLSMDLRQPQSVDLQPKNLLSEINQMKPKKRAYTLSNGLKIEIFSSQVKDIRNMNTNKSFSLTTASNLSSQTFTMKSGNILLKVIP